MTLLRPPDGAAVYALVTTRLAARARAGWTTRRITLAADQYRALMRHLRSIGAVPPEGTGMPLRQWLDPDTGRTLEVEVGRRFAIT